MRAFWCFTVLVVCVGCALVVGGLWYRSYQWRHGAPWLRWGVSFNELCIFDGLCIVSKSAGKPPDRGQVRRTVTRSMATHDYALVGFGLQMAPVVAEYEDGIQVAFARRYTLIVPMWFIMALCWTPIVIWAARMPKRRRMRRLKHKLCVTCGYDLRASADRCPECGTAVPEGHKPEVMPAPMPAPSPQKE